MARHNRLCVIAALLSVLTACGARHGAASQITPPDDYTTTTDPTTTSRTSPSSPPPPSPPNVSESSSPNQDNRCTSAALAGSVESMDAAAGTRYVTLIVRNKSNQTCTLWGFGGLTLLDIKKQPLPTTANRDLDPQPALVTLGPGKEAGKLLHWAVNAAGDEPADGPCETAAASINVLPPDETTPLRVDYQFGPVCDHGKLSTSAYFPR